MRSPITGRSIITSKKLRGKALVGDRGGKGLGGGGGFPIATPTIAVVDADENGISDTNPPSYTIGITTVGNKAVVENDYWQIREDGDPNSGNWITGQFSAGDIIAGSDSATGNTLTAAAHYAQARIRRGDGSPGTLYSAWSAKTSFTAPSAAPVLQDLLDLSPYFLWSLDDLSYVWQDSPGTTTNVASNNDPIGRINDRGSNGYDAVQGDDTSRRPLYQSATPSMLFDGTLNGDSIGITTLTSGPSDCAVVFPIKTSDTVGVLLNAVYGTGTANAGIFDANATSPFSNAGSGPSIEIDGTAYTTRSGLRDAINDGAWHIAAFRNLDISAWTGIWLFMYNSGSYQVAGEVGPYVGCWPEANFSASDYSNTIIPFMQASVGL